MEIGAREREGQKTKARHKKKTNDMNIERKWEGKEIRVEREKKENGELQK